jgi:uncharacterized membrane protein (UPF0127 family)
VNAHDGVRVLAAGLLFSLAGHCHGENAVIKAVLFDGHRVNVEVAATPEERERGLMNRESLDAESGMLFIYQDYKPRSYWMKNTKIPLSAAFMSATGQVLNIVDMKPMDERAHYDSSGPCRFVLEVNKGWFEKNGVKAGNQAKFATLDAKVEGVAIGGKRLEIEVVESPEKVERGLMFRDKMAPDAGMLFVFSTPQILSFWMKNTRLPLSVAFIDTAGKVVNIRDMEPFDTKTPHRSFRPAKYALEMNQGWFAKNGVGPGTAVQFLKSSRESVLDPQEVPGLEGPALPVRPRDGDDG